MIQSLHIDNFALISRIDLSFDTRLTAVTGETGSGKSILVQAISMLRGESSDSNSIREGETVAVIEAECNPRHTSVIDTALKKIEIEPNPDGLVTIRREIHRRGRNRYLINDHVVSKQDFLQITEPLIEINSQHEHQMLLQPRNHLALFDNATHLGEIVAEIAAAYSDLSETSHAIDQLGRESDIFRQRSDLIRFQMSEIDQACLRPEEKEELIIDQQRLRFADEIIRALTDVGRVIGESDEGLSGRLDTVNRSLQKAVSRDPALSCLLEQAESITVMLNDLERDVSSRRDRIQVSPERLEQINERLHFLQNLEGKYRNSIEGILEFRRNIEIEQQQIGKFDTQIESLKRRWFTHYQAYCSLDHTLSEMRRDRASGLCRRIESALAELGMEHARFDTAFSPLRVLANEPSGFKLDPCMTPSGTDSMEFVLSANPGIPLKPLVRVASGGELSRITLALKQHLLSESDADSVVFDEVDSGIGGQTAVAVARQLRQLSNDRQIICITHLPQLAVAGDQHIVVRKSMKDDTTYVAVETLDRDARMREIARMLTGSDDDVNAIQHAQSLIDAFATTSSKSSG